MPIPKHRYTQPLKSWSHRPKTRDREQWLTGFLFWDIQRDRRKLDCLVKLWLREYLGCSMIKLGELYSWSNLWLCSRIQYPICHNLASRQRYNSKIYETRCLYSRLPSELLFDSSYWETFFDHRWVPSTLDREGMLWCTRECSLLLQRFGPIWLK